MTKFYFWENLKRNFNSYTNLHFESCSEILAYKTIGKMAYFIKCQLAYS